MYACLAVTCHLHFWQNDRDFLRATVVTRGWNGYRNKSQHRKSTLEKKILPPFQQGFEPATFQSRVRCSNHWAIPAPRATWRWEYPSYASQLRNLWRIRAQLRAAERRGSRLVVQTSDWTNFWACTLTNRFMLQCLALVWFTLSHRLLTHGLMLQLLICCFGYLPPSSVTQSDQKPVLWGFG